MSKKHAIPRAIEIRRKCTRCIDESRAFCAEVTQCQSEKVDNMKKHPKINNVENARTLAPNATEPYGLPSLQTLNRFEEFRRLLVEASDSLMLAIDSIRSARKRRWTPGKWLRIATDVIAAMPKDGQLLKYLKDMKVRGLEKMFPGVDSEAFENIQYLLSQIIEYSIELGKLARK